MRGKVIWKTSVPQNVKFQNSTDSEEDLTRLVTQLAKKIPGLEPDPLVVQAQVGSFRETSDSILKKSVLGTKGEKQAIEENPMAKLVEEMKGLVRDLPSRVAERMSESGVPMRKKRLRRMDPGMLDEMLHLAGRPVIR